MLKCAQGKKRLAVILSEEKGNSAMSEAKDVIGLLPEAYFDLIARMVPGVITTIVFIIDPNINSYIEAVVSLVGVAGLIAAMLLVAYAIGLVLDTTGDAVNEAFIALLNKSGKVKIRYRADMF
jgi:hypothetical protein